MARTARSDTPANARAKLFTNGRSQAVRLPREFRFEGKEVAIRKEGNAVILEPVAKRKWPAGYWQRIDSVEGLDREQLELGSSDSFWQLIESRRKEKTITRAALDRRLKRPARVRRK